MLSLLERTLWELIESEAERKYYIDDRNVAAITINTGTFIAPDAKNREWYTLYFGQGIAHYNFTSLKKAETKALEILNSSKKSIKVTVKDRHKNFLKSYRFPVIGCDTNKNDGKEK